MNNGIVDYARSLKAQGKIRAVGLSSHEPSIDLKAVQAGWVDVLMFSMNPAYDLLSENTLLDSLLGRDTYANGSLKIHSRTLVTLIMS